MHRKMIYFNINILHKISNKKYSILRLRLVESQIASLRRECNTMFPQCFHTGLSSKLYKQWVNTSLQKEEMWKDNEEEW